MILLPLLGFILLGLFGQRMREPLPGVIASGLVLAAFLLGLGSLLGGGARFTLADWLPGIPFSLTLDNLSGLMVMIVAGIGFLIHVYAIGYMHGDEGFSRFFSYFNFFIAAMLTLVLADSFPVMFIGWEGVGLASYLLIGFWYKDKVNVDSARKAFIVNRIGDLGFLLGMGLLWSMFDTLSISEINQQVAGGSTPAGLGLALFLLFIGAIGKSAQVPLMVWLPDAMAGPTPVSALIHAATMVTAGVYLLARSSPLLVGEPAVASVIVFVGTLTALYGAFCALGQWDIKRIVAYTTISTLGYMMVALGVGAYGAALALLLAHAFYKALLFLTSGSVIHALGGVQDVRRMGGLRKRLPVTHLHGLVGALAMGGAPLLSGFWAKEAILTASLASPQGGVLLYIMVLFTALVTAFYSARWYVLVFGGTYRGSAPVHEPPALMRWPNHLLALGALLMGYLALPQPLPNGLASFLAGTLAPLEFSEPSLALEWSLIALSALVALVGLYAGYRFFQRPTLPEDYRDLEEIAEQGFYINQFYDAAFSRPLQVLASRLLAGDRALLGGYIAYGRTMIWAGWWLARTQSGFLRLYAVAFFLGVVLLLWWGLLR